MNVLLLLCIQSLTTSNACGVGNHDEHFYVSSCLFLCEVHDHISLLCFSQPMMSDKRPPGWPGWRRCRTISTPTGCHGPTQSTWSRTDHFGGCWQPVALRTRSGASRRRRM